MPHIRIPALAGAIALLALPVAAQEINALVWCDHTDPALLEPFEEAHGVTVNVKEYEGTGAGYAVEQSQPGDWDVLVVDAIDVPRVGHRPHGPMPAEALPLGDLFPEVRMADSTPRDGTVCRHREVRLQHRGLQHRHGRSRRHGDLRHPVGQVRGPDRCLRLLPAGDGAYGDRARYRHPGADRGRPAGDPRATLRHEGGAAQVGEVVASQTALATGEVDIVIGGGEFLTAVLAAEMPELDWVIPKQGAVRWAQSIGVLKDAANPDWRWSS